MSNAVTGAPQPTPQSILETAFAFAGTQTLMTACELDLFTFIDEGQATANALAEVTACDPRGIRILLDALCGLGFLTKAGRNYGLTPVARTYLSKNSPAYLGGFVVHMKQVQPAWEQLTETVRTGRPPLDIDGSANRGDFFAEFVPSLYALNAAAAEHAAQMLVQRSGKRGLRVLDIGAGSGVWGLAFLRHDPQARLTVADWPKVAEVAKQFVQRQNATERTDYLLGNFRDADFGENQYDVAILGHICHSEGERHTKELLARLRRALKADGQILIAEFVVDDARQEATLPLLFGINMLVHTEEGDTFTYPELRQWLEEAGFANVSQLEAPSPSPLIVATKAAASEQSLAA